MDLINQHELYDVNEENEPVLRTKVDNNLGDVINYTQFGELETVQKDTQFDIKPYTPSISKLRNIITTTGGATATQSNGEIVLATNTGGTDKVVLDSARRGTYEAGHVAEAGVGVRLPEGQTFEDGQFVEWGYFNDFNGFGFGVDNLGIYVFIIKEETKTKTYQSNWNGDSLSGEGGLNNPSGEVVDLSNGEITNIIFAWYGYGSIVFFIDVASENLRLGQKRIQIHKTIPMSGTSVSIPNLPLRVTIENGGVTTNPITIYVGGRQYSIFGKYNPIDRITGAYRGTQAVSNTAWTPLITFRKKAGENNMSQNVKIAKAEAIVSNNTIIAFLAGGAINAGTVTFGLPNLAREATETVLEANIAATGIDLANANFIGNPFLVEGSNKGSGIASNIDFDFSLPNSDQITMLARGVNGAVTVESALFALKEEW